MTLLRFLRVTVVVLSVVSLLTLAFVLGTAPASGQETSRQDTDKPAGPLATLAEYVGGCCCAAVLFWFIASGTGVLKDGRD
jgi:Mn2+/Fe2+ NRAMP family transporter